MRERTKAREVALSLSRARERAPLLTFGALDLANEKNKRMRTLVAVGLHLLFSYFLRYLRHSRTCTCARNSGIPPSGIPLFSGIRSYQRNSALTSGAPLLPAESRSYRRSTGLTSGVPLLPAEHRSYQRNSTLTSGAPLLPAEFRSYQRSTALTS